MSFEIMGVVSKDKVVLVIVYLYLLVFSTSGLWFSMQSRESIYSLYIHYYMRLQRIFQDFDLYKPNLLPFWR